MARTIEVKVKGDTKQLDRDIESAAKRGERAFAQGRNELGQFTKSAAGADRTIRQMTGSLGGLRTAFVALGGAAIFAGIAKAALDAAVAIDKQLSSLKALTGSAAEAEKRFQALFKLAQQTPGLTTSLAATLDAQLRIFNVAERTIDRLLPVIGRLNAISPLGDPRQFVNNLTQLISQNFERQDLKELVGQSPIAGNLIKEVFNVDNPTNAEAIRSAAKRMGVTTVARLAEELIKAAENNPALQNAVETIGGQFDKLKDRLNVALRPLGQEIAKTLLPIFDDLVRQVEKYGDSAARIFRDNRTDIIFAAKEIGQMAIEIGKLVGSLSDLAAKSHIFRIIGEIAAEARDIAANPIGELTSFGPGPNLRAFQARMAELDAERRAIANSPFLSGPSRAIQQPDAGADNRSRTGGGGARTRSAATTRRERDLLSGIYASKRQEPTLADLQRAIDQNMREVFALGPGGGPSDERIGRLSRAALTEDFERQEMLIKKQVELLKSIPPVLTEGERFMQGFRSATLSVGDAFDRLGQSVAGSFLNIKTLFSSLKQSVLSFFNDLLGAGLQNLMAQVLGPIFGGRGGGGSGGGGLFGNIFRTPGTFPASVSGGALQNLIQAAGGGRGAPASISQQAAAFGGVLGGGGAGGVFGGVGSIFSGGGGGGGGFNLAGIGQSLGDVAPLLGLTLGAGLGGQSTGGKILGGIGGLLGSTFISTTLGAPGALGSLAPALFSNPLTAIAGAGLLVGAVLLGRASQRRKDEKASGEYLTQALNAISQLKAGIASDQIDGAQAKQIFETQILGTFRQQISGLKTKSVVESRLTNQVRDLQKVFNDSVVPEIAKQQQRILRRETAASNFGRMVPEFAGGGVVSGVDRGYDSVRAMLRPGEMVLNRQQQGAIAARAGSDVFRAAGVPGVNHSGRYANGGVVPADAPEMNITLEAQVVISEKTATGIYITGARTDSGRRITVNNVKAARTNREL